MLKSKLSIAMLAAMAISVTQTGQAREFADIYTECGLGALIAPNNGAVAAVTNVTWDSGTTAISSDASSADSCKGSAEKTAKLVDESYTSIARDAVRGYGPYLDALAVARQKDKSMIRSTLQQQTMRSDYTSLIDYQKSEAFFNSLMK